MGGESVFPPICGDVLGLVDDTRWYLLRRRNSVPEEVTGAEQICFHLILPDSVEMRLHFHVPGSVCICTYVCSRSNSRVEEALL